MSEKKYPTDALIEALSDISTKYSADTVSKLIQSFVGVCDVVRSTDPALPDINSESEFNICTVIDSTAARFRAMVDSDNIRSMVDRETVVKAAPNLMTIVQAVMPDAAQAYPYAKTAALTRKMWESGYNKAASIMNTIISTISFTAGESAADLEKAKKDLNRIFGDPVAVVEEPTDGKPILWMTMDEWNGVPNNWKEFLKALDNHMRQGGSLQDVVKLIPAPEEITTTPMVYKLPGKSREWAANAIKTLIMNNGDISQVSDGYHTFAELYDHRAKLFACLCNANPEACFKSKEHDDPEFPMYDGMFICGYRTQEGWATYHYDIDPYWYMFHVPELERAPAFDGHTPTDAINRLFRHFDIKYNSALYPLATNDITKQLEKFRVPFQYPDKHYDADPEVMLQLNGVTVDIDDHNNLVFVIPAYYGCKGDWDRIGAFHFSTMGQYIQFKTGTFGERLLDAEAINKYFANTYFDWLERFRGVAMQAYQFIPFENYIPNSGTGEKIVQNLLLMTNCYTLRPDSECWNLDTFWMVAVQLLFALGFSADDVRNTMITVKHTTTLPWRWPDPTKMTI